jgi:hypothetical protein
MPEGNDATCQCSRSPLGGPLARTGIPDVGWPGELWPAGPSREWGVGRVDGERVPPLPLEGGEIWAGVGREPVQEFFILARARYPLLSRKYM